MKNIRTNLNPASIEFDKLGRDAEREVSVWSRIGGGRRIDRVKRRIAGAAKAKHPAK